MVLFFVSVQSVVTCVEPKKIVSILPFLVTNKNPPQIESIPVRLNSSKDNTSVFEVKKY